MKAILNTGPISTKRSWDVGLQVVNGTKIDPLLGDEIFRWITLNGFDWWIMLSRVQKHRSVFKSKPNFCFYTNIDSKIKIHVTPFFSLGCSPKQRLTKYVLHPSSLKSPLSWRLIKTTTKSNMKERTTIFEVNKCAYVWVWRCWRMSVLCCLCSNFLCKQKPTM